MSAAAKPVLHDLTASEAARLVRRRKVTSLELVEALLARIERIEPALRAFVNVDADGARAAAKAADAALQAGQKPGALHGVPFAAKDIYDAAGLPTTAGYPPLVNNVAPADAFTVARMKAAGAVLIGKTVTTQFAAGDPSPTRNPWRADRTPGGSSSGSGAAVAARLVPIALGTQTGGSILRPAAYNGVVGLKPTYGRISRRGIVPLAWTLDHAGPLVRSVEDAALVLGVLAGHDPLDPRSLQAGPFRPGSARPDLRQPRLGLLTDFVDRAQADVRAHVLDVVARLREAGATVTEIRLRSSFDLYLAAHRLTMQAEAATVHAAWIARERDLYSPRIRGRPWWARCCRDGPICRPNGSGGGWPRKQESSRPTSTRLSCPRHRTSRRARRPPAIRHSRHRGPCSGGRRSACRAGSAPMDCRSPCSSWPAASTR